MLTLLLNSCSTTKIIYVADAIVDCEGVTTQKCFNIKENKEDDWTLFYDSIEGFDYEEGFIYKIEMEITKIKNPPSDGSNLKYKLIRIIYQEKSKKSQEKLTFDGKWEVSNLIGINSLSKSPTLLIDLETKKISGNAGCNSYGSDFSIEGNQLKFTTPVATKMYCSNMKIEKTFFNCLRTTSNYKFVDGSLTFYTKDGNELMTCAKLKE